jgi:Membrane protein involved in the export of O-antigen and teichoic acid
MNNVAYLSLLQALCYLLPLLVVPYLFRTLGPKQFGLIAFAQAFLQYFILLTDYGFNISATKEISICRNDRAAISAIFSAVILIKMVIALLCLLILTGIVCMSRYFQQDRMVYIFGFGTVLGNTFFPLWFFQGTEKMKYIANLNSIGGIALALLIFLFVKGPQDYLMVPLLGSGVALLIGLSGLFIVLRTFGISFTFPSYHAIRQQLKSGWDVFISIAAINTYTTTRIVAVGLFTNHTITGFYSIAEKIANAFQTFPLNSFSLAIFPRLSHIFHKNKLKAFMFMRRIQQLTTIISLAFLPLVALGAPLLIRLICGQEYGQTVLALRLLLISVFFVTANAFRVQFLLVCGETRLYSRIHVITALVGLPLLLLLIRHYSYLGAAAATIILEAGIFSITYFSVRNLRFSK